MENRGLDDLSTAEVLDDDPLEQLRGHAGVPDAVRVDDDDRAAGADTETGRLAPLYPGGSEQEALPPQESGQQLIQHAPLPVG